MSRHLERLLKLDTLIRSRERHTLASLAASVEMSERTIRSDIAFLRDRYNAPLAFTKKDGFHYTDSSWRLPSIPLTQGELFALTLGARMLESYAGSAYAKDLHSAITRLSERLPEQTWVDLQQVAEERILFSPGVETNLNPDVWHQLKEACQSFRRVEIVYYTASRNATSKRKLDPYVLHLYRGTNPYVIGYCHNRQEKRWFRVDRIREIKVLQEDFVPDPNFDAKDHLQMIFQHEAGGLEYAVAIWFDSSTAPYIRERRWHPTQEIEEFPDGALTLRLVVKGLNDLKRWVLGYGKGAVVKEPKELRHMVLTEINSMQLNYGERL